MRWRESIESTLACELSTKENYPMNRRTFIKTTGAAVAGSAVTGSLPAQTSDKPNILFIITDQQHARMLSCTGNPWLNTPALDELAVGGTRYEKAYAGNPVCCPSRIGMATGMMAGRFGILDNATSKGTSTRSVTGKNGSMGQLMKEAGYDTFYGGKVHMTPDLVPERAGYDEFNNDQRAKLPGATVDFIKRKRNKPFFAVASFINPHDICFAYNAYKKREKMMKNVNELYKEASKIPTEKLPPLPDNFKIPEEEPDAIQANGKITAVTPSRLMRQDYDEREWRMYRWIYCRLTEEVDGHIGQILQGLKESGQEDNTLVLFVSDHGDMDASHGLASKGVMYEESVNVPLIIRYPKSVREGHVNSSLVNITLDILPTFCHYAGIPAPNHMLGNNITGLSKSRPYVASENLWSRMIRSSRYKYCVYKDGDIRESLVDLEKDPGEMNNLALDKRYQAALDHHRAYLKDWVKQSGDEDGRQYMVA